MVEAIGKEPERLSGLHPLVPAILMNRFLFPELTDGIVIVTPEVGRIEERRVVAEQIRCGHGRHPAAMWLEQ